MSDLQEKILKLPDEARKEVNDFVDFLLLKYSLSRKKRYKDTEFWIKVAEHSLKEVWDNKEDDIYNELYKG